jgi:alkylhydroperoxidase family enzyme
MSDAHRIHALNLPVPAPSQLDEDVRVAFETVEREHGLLPNVLKAYSFAQEKLRLFMQMYNNLMLAESPLTPLEREMIAVVVSSINRCVYCLTTHGAAVAAFFNMTNRMSSALDFVPNVEYHFRDRTAPA